MKTTRVLLLLAAALLVAVPAYNTVWAATEAPQTRGEQRMSQRGPQRGPAAEAPQARGEQRPGAGWQHPAITPGQQAAYERIISEHRAQERPLRNDMWAKRTELEYLSRTNSADARSINRLVGDMKGIREKMQALHENTASKLAGTLNITSEHAYALLDRGGCGAGTRGMAPCGDGPRGGYHGGMSPCGDGPRGGYHGGMGPCGDGQRGGGHRGWHR